MYTLSGMGEVLLDDITHKVRPLITWIILAKYSRSSRPKVGYMAMAQDTSGTDSTSRVWMALHELFQWARIETEWMCDFDQEHWRAILCSLVLTFNSAFPTFLLTWVKMANIRCTSSSTWTCTITKTYETKFPLPDARNSRRDVTNKLRPPLLNPWNLSHVVG